MINSIFSCLMFAVLLFGWSTKRPRRWSTLWLWMIISLVGFAQTGQKTFWAALVLLVLETVLMRVDKKLSFLRWRFFPLSYASVLLVVHALGKWNVPGVSYLILSSSLDLWLRAEAKGRAFNLLSFPKIAVGPITSAGELSEPPPPTEKIFRVIFFGILKAFILVNLWRHMLPQPVWAELRTPLDYFGFGVWNYVNLYLEFSGACDLVAASFWLFGFGCPLNFDKPYASVTVSEFWKRWHITLGHWIRDHVFIACGGSRVAEPRVMFNLFLAMVLSGLWHGLTWNYLAWGALQGFFLVAERSLELEKKVADMNGTSRAGCWLATQFLVTCSWIIFFGKF